MLGKRKFSDTILRKNKIKYKKHRIYNDLSSTPYFINKEFKLIDDKKEEKNEKEYGLTENELYELYY